MRRSARHLHLSNKKQAAVGKNEDKSMKAGRVSQTVYRRSVLKQIQNNIEGIDFLRPSQEETCYIADESEERITIATDVSLAGNEKDLGVFAIAQAVDQRLTRCDDIADQKCASRNHRQLAVIDLQPCDLFLLKYTLTG